MKSIIVLGICNKLMFKVLKRVLLIIVSHYYLLGNTFQVNM